MKEVHKTPKLHCTLWCSVKFVKDISKNEIILALIIIATQSCSTFFFFSISFLISFNFFEFLIYEYLQKCIYNF